MGWPHITPSGRAAKSCSAIVLAAAACCQPWIWCVSSREEPLAVQYSLVQSSFPESCLFLFARSEIHADEKGSLEVLSRVHVGRTDFPGPHAVQFWVSLGLMLPFPCGCRQHHVQNLPGLPPTRRTPVQTASSVGSLLLLFAGSVCVCVFVLESKYEVFSI